MESTICKMAPHDAVTSETSPKGRLVPMLMRTAMRMVKSRRSGSSQLAASTKRMIIAKITPMTSTPSRLLAALLRRSVSIQHS